MLPAMGDATPFRAVLFDFDYTLGDSSEGIVLCVNRALESLGRPPAPPEAIRPTIGLSLEAIFHRLTGANGSEARRFREAFIACADEVMARHTRLYPGVPALLRTLKDRGLSLGIVTTKRAHRVLEVASRDGIAGMLDVVVGSDMVERPKPDPEGLLLALRRFGLRPAQALFVGDSAVDGAAAQAATVPFAAVLTGETPPEELRRYSPRAVLPTVCDLPPHLHQPHR